MYFIKFKKYLSIFLIPFVLATFILYLFYHAFLSQSGFVKNTELKNQLKSANNEYALVIMEKKQIQKHISLLGKNIDADMLQEKAKKILYYANPDEIVINRLDN
ncbi:MAG: hypothetical protein CML81_07870 [Rhodobiaceae bacterium]|nr:hypothetical protein [Rhodobiaceae bacterium]RPF95653.1 MAG: hypothetical protein CBD87_007820 [Rhizobiales bacterium TMED227]|tara:strand:+ start:1560 stop:1871 length:312 start_codon:yes stop_codon:yes gene_type:complete